MNDQHHPGRAAERVDAEKLLLFIPDESKEGLTVGGIRDAYTEGRAGFSDADFDAAFRKLEADGHVRTTTRRVFGTQVQYYRLSSR